MNIRYILGISGSGKTQLCIEEMLKAQSENKTNTLIYIVPEQFSLSSEKRLLQNSDSKSLIQIKVLSFKNLAYHLFSETGGINKKILEDSGKTMLLRKIAYELSDELVFYNTSIDKQGFLENLSHTITEFFQYGITLEVLYDMIMKLKNNQSLFSKSTDLYLIYKNYLEYIQKEYISTDETLDILAQKINDSEFLNNSEIWIDSFSGFTPQEYKVLGQLAKKSKRINIALSLNSNKIDYEKINPFDPYFETKNTIKKLNEISEENKFIIEKPLFIKDNLRHKNNDELLFLEKNYFKFHETYYNKKVENINISALSNKYQEINSAAENILTLVRDKNYKYKDIGVILGSEDYKQAVKGIFNQFNIPYFIDDKIDIMSHPLTELILSSVDIINSNWSYESIFRFLKTNFTDIDAEEINLIENYVLAYGIKGRKWFLPHWDFGFDKRNEFDENDINYIKDCITEALKPLTSGINNKTKYSIKSLSEKVFNLLYSLNVTDKLNSWILSAKENRRDLLVYEHSQIWSIITEMFDKLVEILGHEKVTINEYLKILKSGLASCDMGFIPPVQDQIIIGDVERTRLSEIKSLFILGVNEGNIPEYKEDTGIFSEDERDLILKSGVEIAPGIKRKLCQDQFSIYSFLTKPSENLYLSYSLGDIDGSPKRPSSIIDRIKNMFPLIEVKYEENNCSYSVDEISAPSPAFEKLTMILSKYVEGENLPDIYKDAYMWFSDDSKFSDRINSIKKGLLKNDPKDYINVKSAKKLYGSEIYSSVSKLEKFTKCPFSFFVEYGLKAKERKVYKISTPDLGNLFHSVLEDFSNTIEKDNLNWKELNKNQINKYVNNSVDNIVPKISSEILLSTSRYKYVTERIKRITKRSVWALSEHIKAGLFTPLGYEIGFGAGEKLPPIIIELQDNSKIILTGKIDRIDILDSEGKKYVKILDYKSYDKKYSIQDIYYGMQLQLILYLDSFLKKGNNILEGDLLPGGMFYFKIDDPILKFNYMLSEDRIDEQILKAFKLNGLLLNDKTVLTALEKEFLNNPDEISISKIKSIKRTSELASMEQFNNLREYVSEIIKDIGDEIINGNVKVEPFKKGVDTGCKYCLFKSICSFETLDKENKYRIIKPLKNPWEDISKKLEQKE